MKKFLSIIIILITLILFAGCKEEMNNDNNFVLKATITKIDDKIEVEIIESDYAFGTYLVITSNETDFINENGKKISKNNLTVGDTVEITYGGQVMMSLPPQIVAKKIKILK